MHSAENIADWFLAWTFDDPEVQITSLKLQKLLYYAQAHYLVETGRPLFLDEIEAWENGPVVPSVYRNYRKYPSAINAIAVLNVDFDFNDFSVEENDFLISIWNTYGKYDAKALSEKTHNELTWITNYYNPELKPDHKNDTVIFPEELRMYFTEVIANVR